MQYLLWGVWASFLALFDIFRGRWWHAFMLSEASNLRIVKLNKPNSLAREYLFNNTNFIYRPMWTYQAEHYGSQIILYFYSTNIRE